MFHEAFTLFPLGICLWHKGCGVSAKIEHDKQLRKCEGSRSLSNAQTKSNQT